MAGWYRVVKTIKGHRYLYDQQTFREGGQVRTRNRYLGPAEGGPTRSAQSRQQSSSGTTTPLFRDPADFGHALAQQFDLQQWGKDAKQQVLGAGHPGRARKRTTARRVTTTQALRDPPGIAGDHSNQGQGRSLLHSPRDVQTEITDTIIADRCRNAGAPVGTMTVELTS